MWLVEAKAVRIETSPWAPLFATVVAPNVFTATVEQAKQATSALKSLDDFWDQFDDPLCLTAAKTVIDLWSKAGYRRRLGPNHAVLEAVGPSKSGVRTVVAVYSDGRVMVPFSAYEGVNSGIPIEALTTDVFRAKADALFGFNGSERTGRTTPGWLTTDRVAPLIDFCKFVATAYASALNAVSES